jgi:HD-like signal output (HDOD) protein
MTTPLNLGIARQEIARLSSLPVMDSRLLKIIGEPETGSQYEQLDSLLHADPALAARVLKVANSAFFGASRAIDSIKRALEVLGTAAVTGIAMAASLDGTVSQLGIAHMGFFNQLRQHSLITAVAARRLTLRRPTETWTPDAAFVLGLVHDLGWLVQLQLKSDSQVPTVGAPTALDGLIQPPPPEAGHALLGAALFSHWGLPAEFASTVLNHHEAVHDGSTPGHQLLAVADRCAHCHPDRLPEGEPVAASALPLHEFQLTEKSLVQFASEIASEALLINTLVRK